MKGLRLRRGDYVILAIALLLVVTCFIVVWMPRADGRSVVLITPNGEQTLSLAQATTVTVQGNGGIVLKVEIDHGRVRVRDSGCPDQVCVNSGWLSQNGQTAACVPAGVSVRVVGGSQAVDGVTA